ncbi:tyrosine-type recombinase/integrase [Achromobacter aloeverae]
MRRTISSISRALWAAKLWSGKSHEYVEEMVKKLEKDVFPWIGTRPISVIESPKILAILNRIEARVAETARRLRGFIGEVFRYAIACGKAKNDPTTALKGAVLSRKGRRFAAIRSPRDLGFCCSPSTATNAAKW